MSFARDASKLRIAGLLIGAPVGDLPNGLAKHGFAPVATTPKTATTTRGDPRADRLLQFKRRDGHTIDVRLPADGQPLVRGLVYGLAKDRDAYEQLRNHLRGLFGAPDAAHGAETGVRVEVWEITGTDMTIEGVLTTSITLIRDSVQGHSLTVRELRIQPRFGVAPSQAGISGRSGSRY